jgi:hypothetical protein
MKNTFTAAILLLLLQFNVHSQSGIISNAIFPECENAEKRSQCGDEKVEYEIGKLLTDEITADLKSTLSNNYFSVHFAFLSDPEGKVIPETLKIKCDNKLLYDALHSYITHLPPFLPKDKSYEERRSVHMYDCTFVYDDTSGKYISASKEKLKEENIKRELMPLGTQPTYKGCENENRETAHKCTSEKVIKIIAGKYRVEKLGTYNGQIKLVATFIVEKDGSVKISEITSTPHHEKAIKELDRALNKLPDFTPASYMDIPVRASYALPVTLNLKI